MNKKISPTLIGAFVVGAFALLVIAVIAQRLRLDLVPGRPVEFFPKASLRPRPNLVMSGSPIPASGEAS